MDPDDTSMDELPTGLEDYDGQLDEFPVEEYAPVDVPVERLSMPLVAVGLLSLVAIIGAGVAIMQVTNEPAADPEVTPGSLVGTAPEDDVLASAADVSAGEASPVGQEAPTGEPERGLEDGTLEAGEQGEEEPSEEESLAGDLDDAEAEALAAEDPAEEEAEEIAEAEEVVAEVEEEVAEVAEVEEEAPAAPAPVDVVFPGRFASGARSPSSTDEGELEALIAQLERCRGEIRLLGHSDSLGSSDANFQLSVARARAVERLLARRGIPARRIEVRGMGSRSPLTDSTTVRGRSENRRVEVQCQ